MKIENLTSVGHNRKISKIRDGHFVECPNLHLVAFWVAFCLKPVHSRRLQTFVIFLPKVAKHDVTKTSFSQKLLDVFF